MDWTWIDFFGKKIFIDWGEIDFFPKFRSRSMCTWIGHGLKVMIFVKKGQIFMFFHAQSWPIHVQSMWTCIELITKLNLYWTDFWIYNLLETGIRRTVIISILSRLGSIESENVWSTQDWDQWRLEILVHSRLGSIETRKFWSTQDCDQ